MPSDQSVTKVHPKYGEVQTHDGPMPGKYRASVIRSRCIAAGPCQALAPAVFKIMGDNIVKVISQNEVDELKLLAGQSCPTHAIIIEDIETGEQIWPEPEL